LIDWLKARLISLLPQHLISRIVLRISRCRSPFIKNNLIRLYTSLFEIDLSDARETDPLAYASWNAFFTRALKTEARPIDPSDEVLTSPVDGTISQIGYLREDSIFQAKGHEYSAQALVGDSQLGDAYADGAFITIYLSPRDYHRIHMPYAGTLRRMLHVPGRLFSVAPHTVNNIEGLFARNERVNSIFENDIGPMFVSLVGAINVGAIETCWAGLVTPPAGKKLTDTHYYEEDTPIFLEKGQEMGRFNLGSTVILLLPRDRIEWLEALKPGSTLRMGQALATVKR
jgi:phosphatidylserine decarboxylase